jgi:3-oxoacyl-[acyl-carrier-protein] synthase-3
MIYNVISDGACAVLLEKECGRNRILAYRQVTKGYYWNSIAQKNEITAAYFPTARNIVRDTLADANLDSSDISCILPHNVSLRSWEILLGLIQIGREKLFAENIAKMAHVIAADNWINLRDAAETGRLHHGDKLLLFTFGFGANWACMVLEGGWIPHVAPGRLCHLRPERDSSERPNRNRCPRQSTRSPTVWWPSY